MVLIASSLYTILSYQRIVKNDLLLCSRGNLYLAPIIWFKNIPQTVLVASQNCEPKLQTNGLHT